MPSWSDALLEAEREMVDEIVQQEVRSTYGAVEVNPLSEAQKAAQNEANEIVDLTDPRLGRITRLRLVTDRDVPFWDLSYCFGTLKDGSAVRVQLPEHQWPKANLKAHLIEMGRRNRVFLKGLGVFDPEVISKLYG